MNLNALAETVADLRAQLAAMESALAKIVVDIDRANGERDAFSVHLYRARKSWRWQMDHPTKGGRREEEESRRTFIEAQAYGYAGTLRDWMALLKLSRTDPNKENDSPW